MTIREVKEMLLEVKRIHPDPEDPRLLIVKVIGMDLLIMTGNVTPTHKDFERIAYTNDGYKVWWKDYDTDAPNGSEWLPEKLKTWLRTY